MRCASCRFDNYDGHTFCIQCGAGLKPPAPQAATEPHPSPEVPHPSTPEILQELVEAADYPCAKTAAGWRVTVPLTENRHQDVHVTFDGHDDDGNDIVSLMAVCGEFDARYALPLLRQNARLTHGAFGVRTIQGKDYIIVTANQLADSADPAEVRTLLQAVARRADELENRMSGGRDVF